MAEILKDTTTNKIGTGDGGITLDPAGTEVVTISNGVVIPDGTKTSPAIRLSDDTNTGIYSPSNDSISLSANGEDVLRATGSPSAVNYLEAVSSGTGADLIIKAAGTDTNIDIDIQSKGSGSVLINGGSVLSGSVTASQIDAEASTDGYVLTSDGAGNAAWEAASGGGATILDDLTDVTIDSSHGAHTYWKLAFGAHSSFTMVSEVEMRATSGGADQCSGGTASGGGSSPASAFDNDTGTRWNSDFNAPSDLIYQFASAVSVVEYTLTSASDFTGRFTNNWTLQYSDDGTNWIVADTVTAEPQTWGFAETRTFTVDPAVGKGTTLVHDGSTFVNVGIGGNNQVLTADNTQSTGVKWATVDTNPVGYAYGGTVTTAPSATGSDSIVIGDGATDGANSNAVVIGRAAAASLSSTAVGDNADATGSESVAIGELTNATGSGAIAIGYSADATQSRSIAIGWLSDATGSNSVGVGFNTRAQATQSSAFGYSVTNSTANSVRIGDSTTCVLHLKDLGRLHLEGTQAAYIAPSYASGSEPTAIAGAIIYDSTNNKLKFYNGTSWETITSA